MLDEIKGQMRDEPVAHARRHVGNPAIQMQFVEAGKEPLSQVELQALYGDEASPEPAPGLAPTALSGDPAAIAAELAITPAMNGEALHRLRRRFALENHPDRLPAQYREIATVRMMIANRLIDDALARRPQ